MLLVIFVLMLIGGIVWYNWKSDEYPYGHDEALWIEIPAVIALFVSVVLLAVAYIGAPSYVASMESRYDMLTYQYENEFYENDNDLGKFELVEEIRSWNEDLASYKVMQRNIWIGVYVPNIYDQFEMIPLDGGGT